MGIKILFGAYFLPQNVEYHEKSVIYHGFIVNKKQKYYSIFSNSSASQP